MNIPHAPAAPPRSTEQDGATGLRVQRGSAAAVPVVEDWVAGEGWGLGRGDGQLFTEHHPDGLFVGLLDGRVASAVWIANHDDRFAFAGSLAVAPGYRGRGLGTATFDTAIRHAGERSVGLNVAPAGREFFARRGFYSQWRTLGYCGPVPPRRPTTDPNVTGLTDALLEHAVGIDARCFPADRPQLAAAWATAHDRHALAYVQDGTLLGYGVIRPARRAARIGPLYAAEPYIAAALFDALAEQAGAQGALAVAIDVPEPNRAAMALAETRGLARDSETIRMVRPGAADVDRDVDRAWLWGITSREIG